MNFNVLISDELIFCKNSDNNIKQADLGGTYIKSCQAAECPFKRDELKCIQNKVSLQTK